MIGNYREISEMYVDLSNPLAVVTPTLDAAVLLALAATTGGPPERKFTGWRVLAAMTAYDACWLASLIRALCWLISIRTQRSTCSIGTMLLPTRSCL